MKKQKKWTIPLIVAIVCAVAVFLMHPGKATAADQKAALDPTAIDYLDPFDLTVRQIRVSQTVSTSRTPAPVATQSSPVPASTATVSMETTSPVPASTATVSMETTSYTSPYAQPAKIWIPVRPTFRSPCIPR